MKGLSWYLNRLLAFFFLIVFLVSIEAQGLTAEELLDAKEKELTRFVGVVEANARNCDALNGCSSTDGCSRPACYLFGTKDDRNYQCLDNIANNSVCGSQCTQRNFDFTKGFVRHVDQVKAHIARTVCTHRTLDDHFKNSSMNDSSHLFRVFFGAVDGTTRLYPGVDENCNDDYDPRLRPWFIESTYVRKGVTLLIDSGLSMRDEPAGAESIGETYLTHAKTMALSFLETLREDTQDYVNLMCFDGDGITPPNAKSQKYNKALLYQSFSDTLDAIIVNSTGSTTNPSAAITSHAINTAISEMNLSVPVNYLKVVIVLTTGLQFQALSELKIAPSSGVDAVFVYNFRTTGGDAECNASVRASSEGIPVERIDNPLFALESYYSFLAKTRRSFMGNQIDYGQKYPDASGIDYNTLTISKAAFGSSGELLGVVGIDFFEKKVEEQYKPLQFKLIVEAARNHDPKTFFDASKDTIPSVCFNHFLRERKTLTRRATVNEESVGGCSLKNCGYGAVQTDECPGLQNNDKDGLCEEQKGYSKIGCCGRCKVKKTEWVGILEGASAGIIGLAGIAALVYYVMARRLADKKIVESPIYSGSDNESSLHGHMSPRTLGPGAL